MPPFVHLIADYGRGDPAFSEVIHRLHAADPTITVQSTMVPPLSTIATGFWIEQLGLHNPPFDGLLIYSNTAPRTDDDRPRSKNEGEELVYLELDTGVPVLAIDAGYNLSFVRDRVQTCRSVDIPQRGSQFRSRDYYPTVVAEIARGNTDRLSEDRTLESVPEPPRECICHVDGYGNIKTGIRASTMDLDRRSVTVSIGAVVEQVTVVEAVFGIPAGTIALAPGSTGGDDPYLELFQRGGSAAAAFGNPDPGTSIQIDDL